MNIKRVLIVEDIGLTALDEMEAVRELGLEVSGIVMTGEDAIGHAGEDPPDMVLMDIGLGGQMDGREAARRIHDSHKIPIIFVTGYGDKATSRSGKFDIPDDFGYIVKPFTREELQAEIKRLIE